ncbi:MAG: FHA domain-containing protein [Myxococcales bacterium]
MRHTFALRDGQQEYVLTPGNFTIGRSSSCDLVVDDPMVSRMHAIVRVGIDAAYLEDAGSHNGVYVNGERLRQRRSLQDGDHIGVGGQQIRVVVTARDPSTVRRPSAERTMPQQHVRGLTDPDAAEPDAMDTAETLSGLGLLSSREREVLAMVAGGHTAREIAEMLGISAKTVEGYRARLGEKLGLRTRAELVRFALAAGLLK